jgi:hypothetical protein
LKFEKAPTTSPKLATHEARGSSCGRFGLVFPFAKRIKVAIDTRRKDATPHPKDPRGLSIDSLE